MTLDVPEQYKNSDLTDGDYREYLGALAGSVANRLIANGDYAAYMLWFTYCQMAINEGL